MISHDLDLITHHDLDLVTQDCGVKYRLLSVVDVCHVTHLGFAFGGGLERKDTQEGEEGWSPLLNYE